MVTMLTFYDVAMIVLALACFPLFVLAVKGLES